MPQRSDDDKLVELLQTQIVLQIFALGATQDKIAQVVGKSKTWVNATVKGLTRPGKSG